jgi:hypothetical protein
MTISIDVSNTELWTRNAYIYCHVGQSARRQLVKPSRLPSVSVPHTPGTNSKMMKQEDHDDYNNRDDEDDGDDDNNVMDGSGMREVEVRSRASVRLDTK